MARWPWIERRFSFDFPVGKFPELLERSRGAPARIEDRTRGLPPETLTRKPSDGGWTIQQNIGHLIDLGYLATTRLRQILAGEPTLIAADMTNRKTVEGDHNAVPLPLLLQRFRTDRMEMISKFEQVTEADWGKAALHPRLQQPMRIVDILYFDSEHDDYHLGRIGELIRAFSRKP